MKKKERGKWKGGLKAIDDQRGREVGREGVMRIQGEVGEGGHIEKRLVKVIAQGEVGEVG